MATSRMMCPICAEDFDDVRHVLKHFRYRRFPCGHQGCTLEFYTKVERTTHCTQTNHRKTFRIIRVPYLDKLVKLMIKDARRLFKRRAAPPAAVRP
ncbi:hypothetical protein CRE_24522 [Caenorhabditis remanei]|uniref:Uncharacterized protein n=2 Tax=Caenorhabditis remanei TaxID=31234 RepID=E3MG27_CAERE|nr:hypothetical protein CRE_24522 [Caenorhabditis remanei]